MSRASRHPLQQAGTHDNAMTEVALALAMGFFSIMVLTLISMGSGTSEAPVFDAFPIVASSTSSAAATHHEETDRIVIFDGARFLDTDLQPVSPETLSAQPGDRVVLAVAPGLTFAQVETARQQIEVRDLVVTTLNDTWQSALDAAAGADPK